MVNRCDLCGKALVGKRDGGSDFPSIAGGGLCAGCYPIIFPEDSQ